MNVEYSYIDTFNSFISIEQKAEKKNNVGHHFQYHQLLLPCIDNIINYACLLLLLAAAAAAWNPFVLSVPTAI